MMLPAGLMWSVVTEYAEDSKRAGGHRTLAGARTDCIAELGEGMADSAI